MAVLSIVAALLVFIGTAGTILARNTSVASDYDDSAYDTPAPETPFYDPSTEETSSPEPTPESSETETPADDAAPQPVSALADHPFFQPSTGAVDTPCELPPFATDVASQDAFYQAALSCLMRAWTPALEEAGLPVKRPRVITTDQDITSPCGTRSWNETAMYCSGNHTIYMTARYYAETEGQTEAGVFLGQFAHEFGHSIQGMTGIMDAYGDAVYEAGGNTTPKGLELSRRTELQATCFEGEVLAGLQRGGLSNEYIFAALEDSSARGDEGSPQRDHGTTANNKQWVERGFYQNRTGQCNTWSAAPAEVE